MSVRRIPSSKKAAVQLHDSLHLVRYVPFARFLSLLDGELPFTPLRLLGNDSDPLESTAITDPNVIERKLLKLRNGDAAIREIKAAAPRQIVQTWEKSFDQQERTAAFGQAFHRFIGETRAASCWFSNPFESAAMWATFARQGVAIETTLSELESLLPEDRAFAVAAIRYRSRADFRISDDNAARSPFMVLRPYLLKGKEFEHEREVRFLTRCRSTQDWFSVSTPNFVRIIRRVIISPYLDLESASRLKNHVEQLLGGKLGSGKIPQVVLSSIIEPLVGKMEAERALDRLYDEYLGVDDALPL